MSGSGDESQNLLMAKIISMWYRLTYFHSIVSPPLICDEKVKRQIWQGQARLTFHGWFQQFIEFDSWVAVGCRKRRRPSIPHAINL